MHKKVHVEEEIYSHEYLWRSAGKLLRTAEAEEDGSYYYLLPSLLMSFLAYEAFINFCGFVLLPELWEDEKQNFKNKGIQGKLEALISELGTFTWTKGNRPYQTLRKLESFRDLVAHGKVHSRQYVTEMKEDGTRFELKHAWDDYISSIKAVQKARTDIQIFCNSLLIEMRKKADHPHLVHDAFEGSLASGSGRSRIG